MTGILDDARELVDMAQAMAMAHELGVKDVLLRDCRTAIMELSWTAGDRLTKRQRAERDLLLEKIDEALNMDSLSPLNEPERYTE